MEVAEEAVADRPLRPALRDRCHGFLLTARPWANQVFEPGACGSARRTNRVGGTAVVRGSTRLIVPLSVERGRKWSLASWRVATLLAGTCLGTVAAHAVDGTWLPTPATNDWNTGTNWSSSPLVPDGTASFDASNTATLTFSQPTTDIGTIQFNPGAPNYTFTLFPLQTLNITAAGIVNNASGAPTFSAFVSSLVFQNSSTAGNATINNVAGGIFFNDSSNAGNATINNGGGIFFNDNSAGGTAIINNMGVVIFANFSTAANATITSAAAAAFCLRIRAPPATRPSSTMAAVPSSWTTARRAMQPSPPTTTAPRSFRATARPALQPLRPTTAAQRASSMPAPPAMRRSSPTTVALRPSSTTAPAAAPASSPMPAGPSIFPAASARPATARSPPARSRARATTSSAAATP